MEGEKMIETLKEAMDPPRRRERPKNSWIRGGTWELIDHRTLMRREGRLTQAEGRKLRRRIKALLKADRIEQGRQGAGGVGDYLGLAQAGGS